MEVYALREWLYYYLLSLDERLVCMYKMFNRCNISLRALCELTYNTFIHEN